MSFIVAIARLIIKELFILLSTIAREVGLIRCHLYIFMWGVKTPFVEALTSSATYVLLFSGLLFLAEAVSMFAHEDLFKIPLPLWAKLGIVLLALWMARHRWKETKSHHRATVFASNLAGLLEEIASMNLVSGSREKRDENLDKCITITLVAFRKVFEKDKKVEPKLNLMKPDPDGQILRIQYCDNPKTQYDPRACFAPGTGGAGFAYKGTCAVYIPAIKHKHGIVLSTVQREECDGKTIYPLKKKLRPAGLIYAHTDLEPYKSILSIPVRTASDPTRAVGVLNVDSTKQNAFSVFDFDVAHVAASAIAMALDIHGSVPYTGVDSTSEA